VNVGIMLTLIHFIPYETVLATFWPTLSTTHPFIASLSVRAIIGWPIFYMVGELAGQIFNLIRNNEFQLAKLHKQIIKEKLFWIFVMAILFTPIWLWSINVWIMSVMSGKVFGIADAASVSVITTFLFFMMHSFVDVKQRGRYDDILNNKDYSGKPFLNRRWIQWKAGWSVMGRKLREYRNSLIAGLIILGVSYGIIFSFTSQIGVAAVAIGFINPFFVIIRAYLGNVKNQSKENRLTLTWWGWLSFPSTLILGVNLLLNPIYISLYWSLAAYIPFLIFGFKKVNGKNKKNEEGSVSFWTILKMGMDLFFTKYLKAPPGSKERKFIIGFFIFSFIVRMSIFILWVYFGISVGLAPWVIVLGLLGLGLLFYIILKVSLAFSKRRAKKREQGFIFSKWTHAPPLLREKSVSLHKKGKSKTIRFLILTFLGLAIIISLFLLNLKPLKKENEDEQTEKIDP